MRIIFLGDVVGRSGRDAVSRYLPELIGETSAAFTVVNAENAAGGYGLTRDNAEQLFTAGADCLTTGNHVWDQRTLLAEIEAEPRILRPANFPPGTPGRGAKTYQAKNGAAVFVINVMGRLFMDPLDDPFQILEREFAGIGLGRSVAAAIVDIHAEASSEKQAIGHFLDGRASLVIGTHTHVPTADHRILPGGTAYQTDAGMCGDYDSVIGMKKQSSLQRFIRKIPGERMSPAEGEGTISGLLVELDDATGLTRALWPIRRGPGLSASSPLSSG